MNFVKFVINFDHWFVLNHYSWLFGDNARQAKTIKVTIFYLTYGADTGGNVGKFVAFCKVFRIWIKFVRLCILLRIFGVVVDFSGVIVNIVEILYLCHQSQYSDHLSIAGISESTMPNSYLLISTNKVCTFSLALSYYCY